MPSSIHSSLADGSPRLWRQRKGLDKSDSFLYLTNRLNNMRVDHLSTTFAALADPTRRAILARLASGELSVTELAKPFEMSLPAISRHLKVLQRAGLVTQGREAQWRPCRLQARPLEDAADGIEEYRRFWTESFDRLDIYRDKLKSKEKTDASKRRKSD